MHPTPLSVKQNKYGPIATVQGALLVSKGVLHRGGGALVFEVGYHPHKNIHVIRVVF